MSRIDRKILIAKALLVAYLVWQVVWRAFGLALMTFPVGMGVGAGIDAIPGVEANPLMGGVTAFASVFVIAISTMGKSITTTGKADLQDIERAFRKAATAAEEQAKKKTDEK